MAVEYVTVHQLFRIRIVVKTTRNTQTHASYYTSGVDTLEIPAYLLVAFAEIAVGVVRGSGSRSGCN